MSTNRKATMLRLTEQDIAIIQRLKQHYGVTSSNEVIRMALRAAERELPSTQAPNIDNAYPLARSQGTPGSEC